MSETESVNTRIVEFGGPSDSNPAPIPEASIRRWAALRELYRQAEHERGKGGGPDSVATDSDRT
jgi:hypothetical protein